LSTIELGTTKDVVNALLVLLLTSIILASCFSNYTLSPLFKYCTEDSESELLVWCFL